MQDTLRRRSLLSLCGWSLLTLALFAVDTAVAQELVPGQKLKTFVEFEILTPRIGGALAAQEWGRVFEKLGAAARFRQAILDDEPAVEETVRGTLRNVKVTGVITRDGELQFAGDRRFSQNDTTRLAAWIDELITYGAQGSPAGKPVWGLTKVQFSEIYKNLSQPVAAELEGLTLPEALKAIALPEAVPLRLHPNSDDVFAAAADAPFKLRLTGLSHGTALAALLGEYGLGFRPLRNPAGQIELVIEPLKEIADPWPVGWPGEEAGTRLELIPELYKLVEVGFDDVPLKDVLGAVSQQTGVKILIDHHACAAKGIDPAAATVTVPEKQTAWILLINTVVRQVRLTKDIRVDEAGMAFLHVAPFVPKPPKPAE